MNSLLYSEGYKPHWSIEQGRELGARKGTWLKLALNKKIMDDIEGLLSLEKCYCGRAYCDYFAGGYGDNGASFSSEDIRKLKKIVKKLVKHLKKL